MSDSQTDNARTDEIERVESRRVRLTLAVRPHREGRDSAGASEAKFEPPALRWHDPAELQAGSEPAKKVLLG